MGWDSQLLIHRSRYFSGWLATIPPSIPLSIDHPGGGQGGASIAASPGRWSFRGYWVGYDQAELVEELSQPEEAPAGIAMAAGGALVGAVGGSVVTMMAVAAWVWWPSPGRPWLGTRAQAIALGTDTGMAIARHLNAVIEAHERFHTPCGNPSYLASGTIR